MNINKLSFELQVNKTSNQQQLNNVGKLSTDENGSIKKYSNSDENKIDSKELENTIKKLNTNDDIMKRGLRFEKVDDLGEWVVKVFNTDTGEIIRQIPSEESIKIAKGLEEIIGTIYDEKG